MGPYNEGMTLAAALAAAMAAEKHPSVNAASVAWNLGQSELHRWVAGERVPGDDKADAIGHILKMTRSEVILLLAESRRLKKLEKQRVADLEAQLEVARSENAKLKKRIAALERQPPKP